jgi:hypothetical protein
MKKELIESIMGIDIEDTTRQHQSKEKALQEKTLQEESFEFSLKDFDQTEATCDFALLKDPDLQLRTRLLLNTLKRDGVPYEILNATRGRMKPNCGVTCSDAFALANETRKALGLRIPDGTKDEDFHSLNVTPTIIRVNLSHEDMVTIYAKAVSCDSENLRRLEEKHAKEYAYLEKQAKRYY